MSGTAQAHHKTSRRGFRLVSSCDPHDWRQQSLRENVMQGRASMPCQTLHAARICRCSVRQLSPILCRTVLPSSEMLEGVSYLLLDCLCENRARWWIGRHRTFMAYGRPSTPAPTTAVTLCTVDQYLHADQRCAQAMAAWRSALQCNHAQSWSTEVCKTRIQRVRQLPCHQTSSSGADH